MTRLLAAIAFLTRIPIRREFQASDVGRGTIFFPAVGAGIGLLQLGAFLLLGPRLPPLLTAVIVVGLSAWVTRGLHLDGVADLADGLGGGATREDALRIMRDPRVGSFGVIALVLVLAVKIAALGALSPADAAILVVAPALSRWASVPLGLFSPYARESPGLGSAVTDHVGYWELAGASALAAAMAFVAPPRLVLVSWVAVAVVTLVTGVVARRNLGGVTGDVLGANVELSEAMALAAAVAS